LKIQESAENDLKTIMILQMRKVTVRAIDIVNELDFNKPSVSVAMKNLRFNGYVVVSLEVHITLTEEGHEIDDTMYERHTLIYQWLIALGVTPETAVEDACRMEHVISAESFEAIKKHVAP